MGGGRGIRQTIEISVAVIGSLRCASKVGEKTMTKKADGCVSQM